MKWFIVVVLAAGWMLLLPLVLHAEKYLGTYNKSDARDKETERVKEAERIKRAAERDDSRSVERHCGKNVKARLRDLPAKPKVTAELSWSQPFVFLAYSLLHLLPINSTALAAQGAP